MLGKGKAKAKGSFKKKGNYTSVGLGLYDKDDYAYGNIPKDRFGEYAKLFREAKEKGLDLVGFFRENKNKKGEKSPDFWFNLDFSKPRQESEEIEESDESEEEDKDGF